MSDPILLIRLIAVIMLVVGAAIYSFIVLLRKSSDTDRLLAFIVFLLIQLVLR